MIGLKNHLGKENDNLFCAYIVCHGVPSRKVWNTYIRWQKRKNYANVICINFKNNLIGEHMQKHFISKAKVL